MVSALVLAGDAGDGVLGMVEVEIEKDSGSLAHDPVTVEHHHEALRKRFAVGDDVGLAQQLGRRGIGEGGELERGALRRELLGEVDKPELAHTENSSKSFSDGKPQQAHISPLLGRMITAPDDSVW